MNEKDTLRFDSLKALLSGIRDGTLGELVSDWKWIFAYTARYRGRVALYTVIGLLSSTLGLASSVAGKLLVDVVVGRQTDRLILAAAVMTGAALLGLLLSNLLKRLSAKLSVDITNLVRQDVFDRVMDADWQALGAFTNGDMLNRFNGDVGAVGTNAVSWLPSVVISAYTFLATFFVIWHYSPVMSLIALSGAPVVLLMSKYLLGRQRAYRTKLMETSSGLYTFESEALYNVDTVKSFGASDYFSARLADLQGRYRHILLAWNMFEIRTGVFMTVLSLLIEYIAFGYGLFLLWGSRITYGTMVLFLQQRSALSGAFDSVVGVVPSFISGSVSARRLRELMDLPAESRSAGELPPAFGDGGLTASLDRVSFAYAGGEPVIRDARLTAGPGRITALVGPSGEGKTTVLRLLLGVVRPASGVCAYTAPSGETLPAGPDARPLIAYVPQGNSLLSGTIAENLRLARPDAADDELIAALQLAGAWDFVRRLPEGLHTSLRERGRGLSEGQAQRIAIARALLRNAPVLLLDEATSALDADTERRVLRGILQKRPDRTVIITTHRPTALPLCDAVYRVTDGAIVSLGPDEAERLLEEYEEDLAL